MGDAGCRICRDNRAAVPADDEIAAEAGVRRAIADVFKFETGRMKMEEVGKAFRLGIWSVPPGKASEFTEAWQSLSEWLLQHLPDERGSVLLEDRNDPSRFISFAPLADPAKVEEVMSGPEFQELWSAVMEICDTVKPHSMRVVGAVGGQAEL